jgi:TolA-binding protein
VRLFGIAPAVLIAALLAQVRASSRPAKGKADAGDRPILLGTDPPGKLKPVPADAGADRSVDGGPDDLHRELQALRARVEVLERELARRQQTEQQLQQLTLEVQQIRQQIADGENLRAVAEQQRQTQTEAVQSGVDTLLSAQQRLASGDWSVESELDRAQASFSGQALRDVQAAREALRNHDLVQARLLLSAAISNARAGK